jgi:DNA (cytosine-5)-methyltransferase 1
MKYGSVCSGIEAASVAWHDLGWEPQWFSEIEQFPSEVLKHRFPAVPNLGDMTTINQNPIADERPIDLLVGGTPCQSFSVAGLRKGLADPRGNLMLTFLSIADKFRPKWVVWENVPGVLSSNGGRDFGTFLGALGELGYGFAYRVLDAQYFGVAQRRRRVFVVGYLGDWRVAAAVLFERESLQGNIKPSRKKREEAATYAQGSVGESGDVSCAGGDLSPTVTSKWMKGYGGPSGSNETGNMVYAPTVAFAGNKQSEIAATLQTTCDNYSRADGFNVIIDRAAFNQGENAQYDPRIETGETMSSLVAKGLHAVAQPIAFEPGKMQRLGYGYSDNGTSPTLRSEPGDNQLAVAQPIAVDTFNQTINERTSQTIGSSASDVNHYGAVLQPMAFPINTENMFEGSTSYGRTVGENNEPSFALTKAHSHAVGTNMAIRRLTPKECERLQGFPDDWTKIPYRNKPADQCPDGPRYKACGNSMAVPVMRWIGERINLIESML